MPDGRCLGKYRKTCTLIPPRALATRRYWAVQPPSMTSSLPVTNDASSEAR